MSLMHVAIVLTSSDRKAYYNYKIIVKSEIEPYKSDFKESLLNENRVGTQYPVTRKSLIWTFTVEDKPNI